MPTNLASSAPHIHPALSWADDLKDWGPQPDAIEGASHSRGRLLWKSPGGAVESGIWICTPGRWRLSIPKEEVCHFVSGRALYREDGGEEITVGPGSVVHFHPGYKGECTVLEEMRVVYMAAPYEGPQPGGAHVMRDPASIGDLVDWGPVPTMIEGQSRTSGRLLFKREGNRAETGIWICTPGTWNCHVTSDELCHFLSGRCTYTHESGDIIEIRPDTAAFFPEGWKGVCRIDETVRKVYMIR
ncbi:MAG: cupin domain-containing protein [Hyphomicrobiaceae bacterium]